MDAIEDGKVEVIGSTKDVQAGNRLPLAVVVQIAGRKMQLVMSPSWSVRFTTW